MASRPIEGALRNVTTRGAGSGGLGIWGAKTNTLPMAAQAARSRRACRAPLKGPADGGARRGQMRRNDAAVPQMRRQVLFSGG